MFEDISQQKAKIRGKTENIKKQRESRAEPNANQARSLSIIRPAEPLSNGLNPLAEGSIVPENYSNFCLALDRRMNAHPSAPEILINSVSLDEIYASANGNNRKQIKVRGVKRELIHWQKFVIANRYAAFS